MSVLKTPRMPPELVDMVIDYLHGDEMALCICGLVCKAWLQASRYHLFHTVNLFPSNSREFLNLLAPTSPPISLIPHVRSVFVRSMTEQLAMDSSVPDIQKMSSRLPVLTSVTQLNMFKTGFGTFQELARFISMFPTLETLILRMVWSSAVIDVSSAPKFGIFRLKALQVDSLTSEGILTWILYGNCPPPIRNVRFEDLSTGELPLASKFLRFIGPSLEDVHLSLDTARQYSPTKNVDFTLNTSLRSVYLDPGPGIMHCASMFFSALSSISSIQVHEITLDIDTFTSQTFDHPDWANVSEILSYPHFSSLQKILFKIRRSGKLTWDDIKDIIKRKLPDLSARDIIQFR